MALANKQNNNLIDNGLKNCLSFVENMIHDKTKFKIQGTSEKLWADDHFLELLERVKLKYNVPFLKMDPLLELSLVVGQTALICHQQNKYKMELTTNIDLDTPLKEI